MLWHKFTDGTNIWTRSVLFVKVTVKVPMVSEVTTTQQRTTDNISNNDIYYLSQWAPAAVVLQR